MKEPSKNVDMGKSTTPQLLLWQLAQLGSASLLLYLLYITERTIWTGMIGNAIPATLPGVEQFLKGEQLGILPGKMWTLFWPLSLIAMSLLLLTRKRWYFLAIAGFTSCLLLIGDRIYYEFFSSMLSWRSLTGAHQVWAVRSSVLASLRGTDLLVLLVFPMFALFGYLMNKRVTFSLRTDMLMFTMDKLQGLFFFILALHNGINAFQVPLAKMAELDQEHQTQPGLPKANHTSLVPNYLTASKDFALHFGSFNYHLKDLYDQVSGKIQQRELRPTELEMVVRTLDRQKEANERSSPLQGIASGRNVIVVSLEAFQHYLLGLKVDGLEITPTLNRLKESALEWDFILDNVMRGGTSDAEFSMLTGMLPDIRQIIALDLPNDPPLLSLPASLGKAGYRTLSLHGFHSAFWNRNVNHPSLGIEELIFQERFTYNKMGMGVPDTTFYQQGVEFLVREKQPFFAFMISLSSHHPYTLVPPQLAGIKLDLPKSMARDYLYSSHYADMALDLLFKALEKQKLLNKTMLILYGDHVAPMDQQSKELLHTKIGIDTASIRERRIPFLIVLPGKEQEVAAYKERYRNVVGGMQDVYPTVLHLLGQDIPYGIYGVHLFCENEDRPVIPFFKKANGFIKNGHLYQPNSIDPLSDEQGLLFSGMSAQGPNLQEHNAWYQQAAEVLQTHQLIFDQRAQAVVRAEKASTELH